MGTAKLSLSLVALTFAASPIHAQGFQNLDFESANISSNQAQGIVIASDALPGWTPYCGASPTAQVGYNLVAAGSTWITLLGASGSGTIYNSLEGNCCVLLQGGLTASDASIRQTALVPLFSESILFKAQPGFGSLVVTLGGQNIPLIVVGNGANFTIYGGNIPALGGQVEELEFSALNAAGVGRNDWNIDSITFSMNSVPEPGSCALLFSGFAWLGIKRWQARRR